MNIWMNIDSVFCFLQLCPWSCPSAPAVRVWSCHWCWSSPCPWCWALEHLHSGASLSLPWAGCECGSLEPQSSRITAESGLRCELKPYVKLIVKINPSNYFNCVSKTQVLLLCLPVFLMNCLKLIPVYIVYVVSLVRLKCLPLSSQRRGEKKEIEKREGEKQLKPD